MLYLLVTGSRNWDDEAFIWAQLTRLYILHGGLQIHHGDCPEAAPTRSPTSGATRSML
jgi:hypothetical protein